MSSNQDFIFAILLLLVFGGSCGFVGYLLAYKKYVVDTLKEFLDERPAD